ncbi:MAG: peptidase [Deinococcus sp.]|nr:peptidase [Deinococcus sp.]
MSASPVVPLFPLPNLVLFPGQVLPLYVFEPRYRALLARVQETGEPFGIVRVRETSNESNLPFHERVSKVGTYAHLMQAQGHEDGTSSIIVVGGDRFRIQDFDLSEPYLSAAVEDWPLEPDPLGLPATEAVARRLLADLLRLRPSDAAAIRDNAPDEPLLLASFAAALLPLTAEQREEALEGKTLLDRLDILMSTVPAGARELN